MGPYLRSGAFRVYSLRCMVVLGYISNPQLCWKRSLRLLFYHFSGLVDGLVSFESSCYGVSALKIGAALPESRLRESLDTIVAQLSGGLNLLCV